MIASLFSRIKRNILSVKNWLSFLAGLSLVFAYAPFSQWWLVFPMLILWLYQLDITNPKAAAKQGYIFGFGWFASGISWVHVSIDQFGGLPLFVSLLLMVLLCLYLALFPSLACYLAAKFSAKSLKNNANIKPSPIQIWLLPSTWVFTEWVRSWFLTGFPWLSIGYSQIDGPFASFAPLIGEVGLTFLIMIMAISIYQIINRHYLRTNLAIISALLLTTFTLGQVNWVVETGTTKKIALVQGNIPQAIKWQPEQELPTIQTYLDMTRQNYDADVLVWPESAIPVVEPLAFEHLDIANKASALNDTAIITGIINYNFESKEFFNSLIVLGKKNSTSKNGDYYYNNANRFYKNHLLPIGEFVPFQEFLRPLAPFFNLPMSSFSRGSYVQPNLIANGVNFAPLICFEIAFPEQLAANFHDDTNILLTVSNDAWFGDSHGPHQHMEIARMRALEFGRPIVRSTNNGITAIADHSGQIIAKIPQFEQAVLKSDVALVEGRTPFSRFERVPTFVMALLLFILAFLINRRAL